MGISAPTAAELEAIIRSDYQCPQGRFDPRRGMTLYLFLPVVIGERHFRSSLEAILGDARRATGRNAETGVLIEENMSGSWLGAIGYLCLVDQLSKIVEIPSSVWPEKSKIPTGNEFEKLLVWSGEVLPDEAAALYALRCAFVHSYGLFNDPRDQPQYRQRSKKQAKTPEQRAKQEAFRASIRSRLHLFSLNAEGNELISLGDRRFPVNTRAADLDPTTVDLRSLGDTVEMLVARLRAEHLNGTGLALRREITAKVFWRACFFMHADPTEHATAQDPFTVFGVRAAESTSASAVAEVF